MSALLGLEPEKEMVWQLYVELGPKLELVVNSRVLYQRLQLDVLEQVNLKLGDYALVLDREKRALVEPKSY